MKIKNGPGGRGALLLCLGALLAGLVACGDEAQSDKRYTFQLYYANEAYIESGDEALGHLTGPVAQELVIVQSDGGMEQYKAMLEGLRDVPKQAPEGSMTMVTDNIRLDMLSVANGIASVDVSAADGAGALSGGSLEELLFIEQITFSLIESFEEIQEVAFLVEGKAADTLMGQMDISEPFNKDSFSGNGI